jgi:hypothetical protein
MEITLTAIKADIGGIGGHLAPSKAILNRVKETIGAEGTISRFYSFTIAVRGAKPSTASPGMLSKRALQSPRNRDFTVPDKTSSRTRFPGTSAGWGRPSPR